MAGPEIPGYEVMEPVGHGGFSVVYRARQVTLGRVVALKVLSVDGTGQRERDRFLREVGLVIRLSGHPHVVTVLDAGVTGAGRPYIAMDFFEFGSLDDRLRAQGPLPAAEVAAIGAKIGGALGAAHQAGILHRDIKPRNILMSRFGEPALADFGVALLVSAQGAWRGDTITPYLTPAHAAPEILDGREASVAADIYSLGSTLYELLAGRPAYQLDGVGFAQLITRVLHDPPPPLTRTDIPEQLREAVLRAMAKDPAARFASAAEFAGALGPGAVLGPGGALGPGAALNAGPAPLTRSDVARQEMPPGRSAEPDFAETMLRPDRDKHTPAPPAGPPARRGWWQLGLAAGLIAALASGGAYLGLRNTGDVRHPPPAPRHTHATVAAPRPRPRASRTRVTPTRSAAAPVPRPPTTPQALTVTATANHSVTLGWSAPASSGGTAVSYDVSWTGAASGRTSGLTGTSFTVTGLMNSATYSFSVTAVNSAGTSQPVTVSQALTPPAHPFNTFRNSKLPLLVNAQPNTQSQKVAVIPVLTGNLGPQVIVACQVTGQAVTDPDDSTLAGDLWDKVSFNGVTGYISDLYVNTPQSVAGNFNSFSDPPLWECKLGRVRCSRSAWRRS
jgi:hypothetical protein